jgi:hypothetical protein
MNKYIGLFAVGLFACTNGQGHVDVTSEDIVTFPAPSAVTGAQSHEDAALTTDAELTLDLHGDLQSLSNLGPLSGSVSKDTVSGSDLAFVRHIQATIGSSDGTMTSSLLCDVDVPRGVTSFDIPRLISDGLLFEYLSEGKVIVNLAVAGDLPPRQLTITHTLVAHMDIAMQGSVAKF